MEPEALLDRLDDPRLRIIDCRFHLADPEAGRRAYQDAHIPGAVYLHLEEDLSSPPGPNGGRHPLPDADRLAERLERLGIGTDHHIVVYDATGDMAPRCWWVLTWMGHRSVQVLDGGLNAWIALGGPLTDAIPTFPNATFHVHLRPELLVSSREEIEDAIRRHALVDSRAGPRYRGEVEPLDKIAGHIPGARHYDWQRVLRPDGRFRPAEELAARFRTLPTPSPVVYCGSGVTACVNALAMVRAGLNPRLYPGSWSDWVSYPDRPVATGAEHPDPEET
jgi:thiosulfate/3-mercaptopyruvate sulfurtransferase